jgi:hypothetical protein
MEMHPPPEIDSSKYPQSALHPMFALRRGQALRKVN